MDAPTGMCIHYVQQGRRDTPLRWTWCYSDEPAVVSPHTRHQAKRVSKQQVMLQSINTRTRVKDHHSGTGFGLLKMTSARFSWVTTASSADLPGRYNYAIGRGCWRLTARFIIMAWRLCFLTLHYVVCQHYWAKSFGQVGRAFWG